MTASSSQHRSTEEASAAATASSEQGTAVSDRGALNRNFMFPGNNEEQTRPRVPRFPARTRAELYRSSGNASKSPSVIVEPPTPHRGGVDATGNQSSQHGRNINNASTQASLQNQRGSDENEEEERRREEIRKAKRQELLDSLRGLSVSAAARSGVAQRQAAQAPAAPVAPSQAGDQQARDFPAPTSQLQMPDTQGPQTAPEARVAVSPIVPRRRGENSEPFPAFNHNEPSYEERNRATALSDLARSFPLGETRNRGSNNCPRTSSDNHNQVRARTREFVKRASGIDVRRFNTVNERNADEDDHQVADPHRAAAPWRAEPCPPGTELSSTGHRHNGFDAAAVAPTGLTSLPRRNQQHGHVGATQGGQDNGDAAGASMLMRMAFNALQSYMLQGYYSVFPESNVDNNPANDSGRHGLGPRRQGTQQNDFPPMQLASGDQGRAQGATYHQRPSIGRQGQPQAPPQLLAGPAPGHAPGHPNRPINQPPVPPGGNGLGFGSMPSGAHRLESEEDGFLPPRPFPGEPSPFGHIGELRAEGRHAQGPRRFGPGVRFESAEAEENWMRERARAAELNALQPQSVAVNRNAPPHGEYLEAPYHQHGGVHHPPQLPGLGSSATLYPPPGFSYSATDPLSGPNTALRTQTMFNAHHQQNQYPQMAPQTPMTLQTQTALQTQMAPQMQMAHQAQIASQTQMALQAQMASQAQMTRQMSPFEALQLPLPGHSIPPTWHPVVQTWPTAVAPAAPAYDPPGPNHSPTLLFYPQQQLQQQQPPVLATQPAAARFNHHHNASNRQSHQPQHGAQRFNGGRQIIHALPARPSAVQHHQPLVGSQLRREVRHDSLGSEDSIAFRQLSNQQARHPDRP